VIEIVRLAITLIVMQ